MTSDGVRIPCGGDNARRLPDAGIFRGAVAGGERRGLCGKLSNWIIYTRINDPFRAIVAVVGSRTVPTRSKNSNKLSGFPGAEKDMRACVKLQLRLPVR